MSEEVVESVSDESTVEHVDPLTLAVVTDEVVVDDVTIETPVIEDKPKRKKKEELLEVPVIVEESVSLTYTVVADDVEVFTLSETEVLATAFLNVSNSIVKVMNSSGDVSERPVRLDGDKSSFVIYPHEAAYIFLGLVDFKIPEGYVLRASLFDRLNTNFYLVSNELDGNCVVLENISDTPKPIFDKSVIVKLSLIKL